MIGYEGKLAQHTISNRLYPHLGLSNVLANGGFLQLSNGGQQAYDTQYYLRHTSRSFLEKQISLSSPFTSSGADISHYYPRDNIIFKTNGPIIYAINAKNGLILYTIDLSIYNINSIFWLSCNRITKKLHIRGLVSGSYKTFVAEIKTGDNIVELIGIQSNRWGVYDYKHNVFYNHGNFAALNKIDGTTGEVVTSVNNNGNVLSVLANSRIEIDKYGHVLIYSNRTGTLVITLLDSDLNILCYSNVDYPADLKNVTLDKNGSGNYYYSTVSVTSGNAIQQIEIWKYDKQTGGIRVSPKISKLYNGVTNSWVSRGITQSIVTAFVLNDSLFVGVSSFGDVNYRPFWFLVNKSDLEVSGNPLNWEASSRYNATDYLPYYGIVGE